MLCPDTDRDCDNPGCRRGGCQGRRPSLPLFRLIEESAAKAPATVEPAMIGPVRPAELPWRAQHRA